MTVEAVQAAVEIACRDFQDPLRSASAGQILLQFRQSSRPVAACRQILDHSALLEARFHAACTLRDAVVREWISMTEIEVQSLRSYLLHYCLLRCTSPEDPTSLGNTSASAVRSTMMGALAVLIKRGWLDSEGNPEPATDAAIFQEMFSLVSSGGSAACQRAGCEILTTLLVEFSVTSASPLGLPWDYHDKASRDLEERYLQGFFQHAVSLGRQAAGSGAAIRGEDAGTCAACLSLMAAVLGWDFRHTSSLRASSFHGQAVHKRMDIASVAPGQSWSQVLLAPETSDWLVSLMEALLAGPTAGLSSHHLSDHQKHLLGSARQLLVAFCSLSGEVLPRRPRLPSQQQGEAAMAAALAAQVLRYGYLKQMLKGVFTLAFPLESVLQRARQEEGQLLDVCRCISALSSNHTAAALMEASQGLLPHLDIISSSVTTQCGAGLTSSHGCLLPVLEQLTLSLVAAGGVSSCDEEPWLHDCTDMMLEAWSSLLQPDSVAHMLSPIPAMVPPPPAAPHAAAVFRAVIEAALRDAASGAHEDALDEEEAAAAASEEDWMMRAAALARAAPGPALGLLSELLRGAQGRLFECVGQGADPSEVLEQLVWLLHMSAHALADSGAGETPLMPLALLEEAEAGGAGAQALQTLCEALLEVPALVLQPSARAALSPRLMEAATWALARWCDTYLLPEEPLPGNLQVLYGAADGPASQLLDGIVQFSSTCLISYPGEAQLHKRVCTGLLPVLVRRKSLCSSLVNLGSWRDLAAAFATRQQAVGELLGGKLQRALSQSLCLAAAGMSTPASSRSYVSQLMQGTVNELTALADRCDQTASASCQSGVDLHSACLVIEAMRGATIGTLSATQPAVWNLSAPLLGPMIHLYRRLKGHSIFVALLLKLAAEMVDNHVSFLKPAELDLLIRWVLELLQQYSQENRWSLDTGSSKRLQEERQSDQCRHLRALLKLLSHLTNRDLVEQNGKATMSAGQLLGSPSSPAQGGAGQHQRLDVAQVVLLGLNIVLPLLSVELLKFPKLCHLYFQLLSYMLEVYAPQVASLPTENFGMLMQSLEFGMQHADPLVVQASLEGLAGIARHQHEAVQLGLPGFGAHRTASGQAATARFLELLLRRLLIEELPTDLIELAADALLPLIITEEETFRSFCNSLASALPDPALGSRVFQVQARLLPDNVRKAGQEGVVQSSASSGILNGAVSSPGLSRQTRRLFRQALSGVVVEVRGLISTR
ncbi:hypothetical protein CEUSTIGMA_g8243.t1 [Chlamydomonas eustigma]|uniref:Exportin-4 n=1 Tax=Chlamydomonas eustigma TaxID=1157962 RepID=A0A250XCI0_9CHLO|nr:hypothetical protein CEUSTIGMA_g8243.t1 [Chlamydomonas eustigma]|eukprot:GAX80807.1 hypothetical protein CEUSTIGMA_g8243.t1 [Chlamydomonas eustigma]